MIIIYWIETGPQGLFPRHEEHEETQLSLVLQRCQQLRADGYSHVCISSEPSGSVGKPGVDAVENGLCPDGVAYDWKKRR